ncbi:MAG: hypothetical protein WC208_15835 [Gallionella sp.]|jgi:hypothetical protein
MISSTLDYTPTDWSRWDSFDLNQYSYIKRQTHGLQSTPLTATGATSNPQVIYFSMFKNEAITSFYETGLLAFKYLQTAPGSFDDYPYQYQKTGNFPVQSIVNKMNYTLSQAYNTYRTTRKAPIRYVAKNTLASKGAFPTNVSVMLDDQTATQFDTVAVDFRAMDSTQPIIVWLSDFLTQHLADQCIDPNLVVNRANPNDWRGATWNPYGVWKNHVTGLYDQDGHWWQAGDIGYLYGHYLHLLSTPLIRQIRVSALASIGALWTIYQNDSRGSNDTNMANYSLLESQWMLRLDGWVMNNYILQRSQDELTKRGVWGHVSEDLMYECTSATEVASRLANHGFGHWSLSEVNAQVATFVSQLYTRMTTQGLTEFLSVYSLYHQNTLSAWLLHCPATQAVYDQCSAMWKLIQRQMVVNFHPASGSFPGASGRSHDLFSGFHNSHDTIDQPLYLAHVLKARAKPATTLRVVTGNTPIIANLALPGTSYYFDPKYPELTQTYRRNAYTYSQLAGEGVLPFQWATEFVANATTHINEDRFSLVSGQERYNFLSPQLAMGHSGENSYMLGGGIFLACRISGEKAPPVAGPFSQTTGLQSPASSYIRLMTETIGNPFLRPSALGMAGNDVQRLARSVVTQYQGFMLVTHMFAPTGSTTVAEMTSAPWNSNLILPLAVDSLTMVNGVTLSTKIGTDIVLPLTEMCFSIRHGNAVIVVRLVSADYLDTPVARWQVTADSYSSGCGTVVLQHRQKNSSTVIKPVKVVWLFGGGKFTSQTELMSLQQLIYSASVKQEYGVPSGIWDETNQPHLNYPDGSKDAPIGEVGARRWITTAQIGNLKLGVDRVDAYLPWGNSPVYGMPRKGPINVAPYYLKSSVRTVNGVEVLKWGESASRSLALETGELFEPHRGQGNVVVGGDGSGAKEGWTYE